MIFEIKFTERSKIELFEAYEYYESRQIGLGNRFATLNSFPFLIIYKEYLKSKEIIIYSVFHTSKNPTTYPK